MAVLLHCAAARTRHSLLRNTMHGTTDARGMCKTTVLPVLLHRAHLLLCCRRLGLHVRLERAPVPEAGTVVRSGRTLRQQHLCDLLLQLLAQLCN